jgi:hypothetical protein
MILQNVTSGCGVVRVELKVTLFGQEHLNLFPQGFFPFYFHSCPRKSGVPSFDCCSRLLNGYVCCD